VTKSLINGEGIYDYGYDAATSPHNFNGFRARQVGWLSWLSGTKGYTWGASGLWEWGICGLSPRPTWATAECAVADPIVVPPPTSCYRGYDVAMPSADHVQRLRDALSILNWNSLVQNEQWRIQNQPSDPDRMMVVARDPDILVAYLPHNETTKLDLSGTGVEPMLSGLMWSPRFPGEEVSDYLRLPRGNGVYEYWNPTPPPSVIGSDDWVLALFRPTSKEMAWGPAGADKLDAGPGRTADGRRALVGQLRTANGAPKGSPIVIEESEPAWPARVRVARDGTGAFVLAWEHHDNPLSATRIRLALLDSTANPRQGNPAVQPPVDGADQLHPAVAADASGRFLVAWQELSASYGPILQVQPFDRFGFAVGSSFSLDSVANGTPSSPRAACAPNGECVITWEHRLDDALRTSIRVQRLDTLGSLNGSDFEIVPPSDGNIWLTFAAVDAAGRTEVRWERFDSRGKSQGIHRIVLDRNGEVVEPESLLTPPAVAP
jgi:hypothetical protein